ncbi:MAG: helix-turn-helix domain-containing protein [Candidatus Limnocylindrales bacterium]
MTPPTSPARTHALVVVGMVRAVRTAVDISIARKLLDLAARFGVTTERGTLIQARLTQQELAEMVGTTRETLAHTLAEFRRRGLLDTLHHQVLIRAAERLADLAGGEEL